MPQSIQRQITEVAETNRNLYGLTAELIEALATTRADVAKLQTETLKLRLFSAFTVSLAATALLVAL